jgi:hypothetical protein
MLPMLSVIGFLPLLGGCDYDDHHDYHERRAYPAGYRYERDGYYYDHDRDWDHDHWRDRDDWRRDRY